MEDLISRQAAMNALKGKIDLPNDEHTVKTVESYMQGVIDKIKLLPSAEPNKEQIKIGEWEMFELITSVYYGKQYYFKQENGIVYSRACKYMSVDDAIKEFLDVIGE